MEKSAAPPVFVKQNDVHATTFVSAHFDLTEVRRCLDPLVPNVDPVLRKFADHVAEFLNLPANCLNRA